MSNINGMEIYTPGRFTLPGDEEVEFEDVVTDQDTYNRNTIYAKDGQPWVRGYGATCMDSEISIIDMMKELCAMTGPHLDFCPRKEFEDAQNDDDGIKAIGNAMMFKCDAIGCPLARIYFGIVGAAENHSRLRMLEDVIEGRDVAQQEDLCPLCSGCATSKD